MADSHSSGDYSDVVSRRKFVSLAGATGAAAVAGCITGDDGTGSGTESGSETSTETETSEPPSDEDETGGGGYDQVDTWFLATQTNYPATDYQWNPIVGWWIPHDTFGMWAQWTQYLLGEDEFYPHLIQDWSHSGGQMTLTLSDQFTWGRTGEPVDAEDLVLQLDIRNATNHFLFDFVEDYEASGDYELTLSYPEGTNTDLIDYAVLPFQAEFPPDNWEGANWEEDAGGVEVADPDSSGPVHRTVHNDQYSQTEVRSDLDNVEDHFLAENYNWNGYRVEHRSGNNAAHQTYINGDADGQHSLFVPPDVLDQFPDGVREFQIPGGFGMGLWFDHSHEVWGDRNVRQAFMYSIDREAVILTVSESSKIHHPAPTGLTAASVENWLGSETPDGFNVYTRDDDQAESLLSDAGYSKGDIDVAITFPSGWSDWATACQSVVDQLNDAGWNAEADSRSGGPGGYANSDDWVVAADQHTQGGTPAMNHAYYSLRYILNNTLRNSDEHFAGYLVDSSTVTIDGEEIDVMEQLNAFTEAQDRSTQEDIAMTLAEVVNKDVPVAVIMEKYEQSFLNTNRFDIPDDSPHFQSYWPLWWLPKVDEESLPNAETPGLMKANGN